MPRKSVYVRGWMPAWLLEAFRLFVVLAFKAIARVDVRGQENLPASGGFIISPNHLSYFDAPLVLLALKGRRLAVFAADKYRSHPFFRLILEGVDCIWAQRGSSSPATVKAGIRSLQAGRVLGVAPEGTRSRSGALLPGRTGAVFLAMAAGVPIVPGAITGTQQVSANLRRLRRTRLTLTLGRPLEFPAGTRPTPAQLETHTTELMCRIAAMLPPDYRGAYADHPRVEQLRI